MEQHLALSWSVAGKDVGEQTAELQSGISYLKRRENQIKIGASFCKHEIQQFDVF